MDCEVVENGNRTKLCLAMWQREGRYYQKDHLDIETLVDEGELAKKIKFSPSNILFSHS